jgi:hypothetical protein
VWFAASRTISYGLFYRNIRKGTPGDQTVDYNISGVVQETPGFLDLKSLFSYSSGNYILEESLFFWGDIPTVPPAVFSCNRDIICSIKTCTYPYDFSPCDGIICPSGSSCNNGLCIEDIIDPPLECQFPCPIGWECINGECVEGQQQ